MVRTHPVRAERPQVGQLLSARGSRLKVLNQHQKYCTLVKGEEVVKSNQWGTHPDAHSLQNELVRRDPSGNIYNFVSGMGRAAPER